MPHFLLANPLILDTYMLCNLSKFGTIALYFFVACTCILWILYAEKIILFNVDWTQRVYILRQFQVEVKQMSENKSETNAIHSDKKYRKNFSFVLTIYVIYVTSFCYSVVRCHLEKKELLKGREWFNVLNNYHMFRLCYTMIIILFNVSLSLVKPWLWWRRTFYYLR